MTAEEVMHIVGAAQGWDARSQLGIALEYIQNQMSEQAFEDHVRQAAADENGE